MSPTEVNVYEMLDNSLEYLPVKVDAFKAGSSYNPTGKTVQIAVPQINADIDVYYTASWETIDGEYYAKILIGPDGDVDLDIGDYDIFVKVIDDPEAPIIRAGLLRIL